MFERWYQNKLVKNHKRKSNIILLAASVNVISFGGHANFLKTGCTAEHRATNTGYLKGLINNSSLVQILLPHGRYCSDLPKENCSAELVIFHPVIGLVRRWLFKIFTPVTYLAFVVLIYVLFHPDWDFIRASFPFSLLTNRIRIFVLYCIIRGRRKMQKHVKRNICR